MYTNMFISIFVQQNDNLKPSLDRITFSWKMFWFICIFKNQSRDKLRDKAELRRLLSRSHNFLQKRNRRD